MLGPMCGFLLGSLCAKLYVDVGFVDLGKQNRQSESKLIPVANRFIYIFAQEYFKILIVLIKFYFIYLNYIMFISCILYFVIILSNYWKLLG